MKHWILSAFMGLFFIEVFSVFPSRTSEPAAPESNRYVSGLINVHTQLSDGSLDVPQIATLAKQKGHSFVIFADHNSVAARQSGLEKSYDGLDAFIEVETSTPSGDLLLFFSHTPYLNSPVQELSKLAYDRFSGGQKSSDLFVSVSHPSHIKRPWTQLDRFPDGMEVINFDSIFLRKLYSNPLDFLGLSLLYPLNPFITSLRINHPYPKDLANWDNMNSLEPGHFGFLSSQFTQKLRIPQANISWPEYEELFRLGSNIVFLNEPLSQEFSKRKNQIYRSIKAGRLAMVLQSIHSFAGNDFQLKCPNDIYRSGDVFKGDYKGCEFIVRTPESLPYSATIRFLRNGQLVKEITSSESEVHIPATEPGQFRVEILVRPHTAFWILLRKWVPYVIYNPIFIS